MASISINYAQDAAHWKAFASSKLRPRSAADANASGDVTVIEAVSTAKVAPGGRSASTATSISSGGSLVVVTSRTTVLKGS